MGLTPLLIPPDAGQKSVPFQAVAYLSLEHGAGITQPVPTNCRGGPATGDPCCHRGFLLWQPAHGSKGRHKGLCPYNNSGRVFIALCTENCYKCLLLRAFSKSRCDPTDYASSQDFSDKL